MLNKKQLIFIFTLKNYLIVIHTRNVQHQKFHVCWQKQGSVWGAHSVPEMRMNWIRYIASGHTPWLLEHNSSN